MKQPGGISCWVCTIMVHGDTGLARTTASEHLRLREN